MKALKINAYGGPEVLSLTEAPRPSPKPGEILVRVVASPVTQADAMMRRGTPRFARLMLGLRRPKNPIPGTGFAGIVEEVGAGVTSFAPGEAVFGETALGFSTHAEFVAVPADGLVMKKPARMSFEEAAPLCDGALTSWNFLHRMGQIRPGERVLVNGATGGLGSMAVQIARAAGAEVTAVSSARNAALAMRLGAHEVLDYRETDFTRDGARYDVIFDTPGKLAFRQAKRALKPGGRFLSPVLSLGLLVSVLTSARLGDRRAQFCATGTLPKDTLRPMLADIVALIEAGRMTTVVDRVYPLDHARAAHEYVEQGRKVGNVILAVGDAEAPKAAA